MTFCFTSHTYTWPPVFHVLSFGRQKLSTGWGRSPQLKFVTMSPCLAPPGVPRMFCPDGLTLLVPSSSGHSLSDQYPPSAKPGPFFGSVFIDPGSGYSNKSQSGSRRPLIESGSKQFLNTTASENNGSESRRPLNPDPDPKHCFILQI